MACRAGCSLRATASGWPITCARLADPGVREVAAGAALDRARARFGLQPMLDAYADLFASLAGLQRRDAGRPCAGERSAPPRRLRNG